VANAREILMELQREFLPSLERAHPGLIYSIEGEQQDTRESVQSLLYGFVLAILLIYLILSTIFRSYVQPFIILITVPFGLVGALAGHLVMGIDVTMMSLFGMVALTGIVVNDAIILIECVNTKIAEGTPFFRAIAEGGCRRFRAIMLTSFTTCAGLFPIITEKSVQAQYLIPMALAIASGVIAATMLTLFLVPCLVAVLNDLRVFKRWILKGDWPAREEVEPSRKRLLVDEGSA
jgi:multidrug efflux pump subunit AcrB